MAMKPTFVTIFFIMLFIAVMVAVAGTVFITHAAVPPTVYQRIGIIEAIALVIGISSLVGMLVMLRAE